MALVTTFCNGRIKDFINIETENPMNVGPLIWLLEEEKFSVTFSQLVHSS